MGPPVQLHIHGRTWARRVFNVSPTALAPLRRSHRSGQTAVGLRLGVGLNASRTAPRGIYRTMTGAPVPGTARRPRARRYAVRRSRGSHGPATAGGARSSFSREPARLLAIVLRSAASLPLELRAPAAGDPLGRSGVWAGCISPPSRRRAPSRECRLGGRVRHTGCPIPGAPCAEQPPSSAATRCRPQSAWESGWWWKSTSAVDCATATSVFFGRPS